MRNQKLKSLLFGGTGQVRTQQAFDLFADFAKGYWRWIGKVQMFEFASYV